MHRPLTGFLLVAAVSLNSPAAGSAASFDCMKASSRIEKMICAHEDISREDEILTAVYRAAYRRSGDRKAMNASQRSWLKERGTAAGPTELKAMYDHRIRELKKGLPESGPKTPGAEEADAVRTYESGEGEIAINDLGYGKAAFRMLVVNHQGHIGEVRGIMSVVDGVGRYVTDSCELTVTFGRDRLTVRQNFNRGICGAGSNVALDGVYRKVRRKRSGGH